MNPYCVKYSKTLKDEVWQSGIVAHLKSDSASLKSLSFWIIQKSLDEELNSD